MSKTLFVDFRGKGFWAFDVVSAVFLKHLIDAATAQNKHLDEQWLADAISKWRVNAVVSDFGLFLDEEWSREQINTVTALAKTACDALSKRESIRADEIDSWRMVDDLHSFARDLQAVPTTSSVQLGDAIVKLINGTLPEAPRGTWWLFTIEGCETIRKQDK